MHRFIILLLGTSLFLSACKNRVPKKDAYIYYERTACFGNCPIFNFTLHHNGLAVYEGKRFVKNIGRFEHQFSKAETKQIFKEFDKGNWEAFETNYPTNYSDLPGKILGFHYKHTDKQVRMDGEHPAFLDALMLQLDSLIQESSWTSTILE